MSSNWSVFGWHERFSWNTSELLQSFIQPYKGVTTQAIFRWILKVLDLSRIDTRVFTSHSLLSLLKLKCNWCIQYLSTHIISSNDMLKRGYWILDPVFNVWGILSKKKTSRWGKISTQCTKEVLMRGRSFNDFHSYARTWRIISIRSKKIL